MKFFWTIILSLCISGQALATAQQPDYIIYKGKKYPMFSNPLEAYFEAHPEQKPQPTIISTALWRGYIATFEVKDGELRVKDIEIYYTDTSTADPFGSTSLKSVMDEVFPNQEIVKVDWFTGLLVIPRGRMLQYVHMGYGSTFSKYTILEIKEGCLTNEKKFRHRQYQQFKKRQFKAYKKTEAYRRTKEELMAEGRDEEFIDRFLEQFIISYTSTILADHP